jgi:hypothetical protein
VTMVERGDIHVLGEGVAPAETEPSEAR